MIPTRTPLGLGIRATQVVICVVEDTAVLTAKVAAAVQAEEVQEGEERIPRSTVPPRPKEASCLCLNSLLLEAGEVVRLVVDKAQAQVDMDREVGLVDATQTRTTTQTSISTRTRRVYFANPAVVRLGVDRRDLRVQVPAVTFSRSWITKADAREGKVEVAVVREHPQECLEDQEDQEEGLGPSIGLSLLVEVEGRGVLVGAPPVVLQVRVSLNIALLCRS